MALKQDVELLPHQNRAVNRLVKSDGKLLFYHDVGTGKTLSSIAGMEKLKELGKAKKALVVVPASLRENFAKDGVKKFTNNSYTILGNKQELGGKRKDIRDIDKLTPHNSSDYNIVSYDLYKRDPKKYIENTGADTVIYDELHRAKNEGTKVTQVIREAKKHHKNFIGLTGSLTSNSPGDMVPLIDAMTDGKHILGTKEAFSSRFMTLDSDGKKVLKDKKILQVLTSPYVDFMSRDDMKGMKPPKIKPFTHEVTMGSHQSDLYRAVMDDLDPVTKAKLLVGVGKMSDAEMKKIGNKLMGARMVSNAPHTVVDNLTMDESLQHSAKVKKLVENVKKHIKETPDAQVLIGTQFIKGGVDILAHALDKEGIKYGMFIGKGNKGVNEASRNKAVSDYNSRKTQAMIISSAGGEGLNLPNTTSIHMLDGHFNPEVINQMAARGIRAGGLSHRPEDKRIVEFHKYIAKPDISVVKAGSSIMSRLSPMGTLSRLLNGAPPPTIRTVSADKIIDDIAQNKNKNNREIKGMFRKTARYLGSEKDIQEAYYKEYGDRLPEVIGTNDFLDREGEGKYIKKLDDLYSSISKAKRYGILGKSTKKPSVNNFGKDDFDPEDGELKTLSAINPLKNKALQLGLIGTGGGLTAIALSKGKNSSPYTKQLASIAAPSLAVPGALGLLVGGLAPFTDYGEMSKSKAMAKKRLGELDKLKLIRGEGVNKVKEKIDKYAI